MAYLLDSDFVIDYLQDVPEAIRLSLEFASEGMSMSAVTYMEGLEGTLRADDPSAARSKLDDFVSEARLLDFNREVAIVCAGLRASLRARGVLVNQRAHDLQIAATAAVFSLTVVTRNTVDYLDVGVEVYPYK